MMIIIYALFAVILSLCGLLAYISHQHYKERKDLYNRIMCRDIQEYKNVNKEPKSALSAHDRVMKDWRKKE